MSKRNQPPAALPEPPEGLSEAAQGIWRQVIGNCRQPGRQAVLLQGLRALDRANECRAAVDRDGMTTTTKTTGAVHLHPLLKAEREFRAQFLSAATALHLTSQASGTWFPPGLLAEHGMEDDA